MTYSCYHDALNKLDAVGGARLDVLHGIQYSPSTIRRVVDPNAFFFQPSDESMIHADGLVLTKSRFIFHEGRKTSPLRDSRTKPTACDT